MYTAENKTTYSSTASNGSCSNKLQFFQPKLAINEPGDKYEQEADRMANHVMRMSINGLPFFTPASLSIPNVQRKCQHCEEEGKLQRKETNYEAVETDSSPESYINSLNGKGRPLTKEEKNFFEPRFGSDFSSVQLHTNSEAGQSAKNINALAYTHGDNIVFGSGQYQSSTDAGKRLMAHELTHVVQQKGNIQKTVQRAASCESVSNSMYCNLMPCVTKTNRAGRCFWGMPDANKKRCHCRDTSTDEPPVSKPVDVKEPVRDPVKVQPPGILWVVPVGLGAGAVVNGLKDTEESSPGILDSIWESLQSFGESAMEELEADAPALEL